MGLFTFREGLVSFAANSVRDPNGRLVLGYFENAAASFRLPMLRSAHEQNCVIESLQKLSSSYVAKAAAAERTAIRNGFSGHGLFRKRFTKRLELRSVSDLVKIGI